jgi:hypothetical protein
VVKYESPGKKPLRIDVPLSLTRKSEIQNEGPYFDTTEVLARIANPAIPLFITESARKADSAVSIELCCILLMGVWGWRGSNSAGGKTALADWDDIALNDRVVYLSFDSDVMTNGQVHQALTRLQELLIRRGATVRFIYLPPGPSGEKVGLDDFIAAQAKAGVDAEQIRAKLLEFATDELPRLVHAAKARPDRGAQLEIVVNNRQLREKVEDTLQALVARNEPPLLFSRDGNLVRLRGTGNELEEMASPALLAEMSEAADWFVETKMGLKPVDPPGTVGTAILGSRQLPFPRIEGIVRSPFFTAEGELVVTPGYHPQAQVYLALDPVLAEQLAGQDFSVQPTAAEVQWANAQLDELFCDFPFKDGRQRQGRAHIKSLMLLPFVRLMIDGPTPIIAVGAPEGGEGTGKGLLLQTACVPGLGEVSASPETDNVEELRKTVGAAILQNTPIVWFDNIKGEVGAGPLASILTARNWSDRILGQSRRFNSRVLTTWAIAGNGLRFSREIGRRTVLIELDALMPRAWLRTGFAHILPNWALENRATLIRACIILVQNWIARGCQPGKRTLGSYEQWARIMGGILDAASVEGFLEGQHEQSAEADREAQRWTPFIENWVRNYPAKTDADKANYATEPVTAGLLLPLADDTIPDDGKSDKSRTTRLGNMLARRVGRTFEIKDYPDHYLRIVRAEVAQPGGRTNSGYALNKVIRHPIQVREDPENTTAEHCTPANPPFSADEVREVREIYGPEKNLQQNQIVTSKSISPNLCENSPASFSRLGDIHSPNSPLVSGNIFSPSVYPLTSLTSEDEIRGSGSDDVLQAENAQHETVPDTEDEGVIADLDDDEETAK